MGFKLLSSVLLTLSLCGAVFSNPVRVSEWESDPAVIHLREYLRIRTVQPDVNYDEAIKFLSSLAFGSSTPHQVVLLGPHQKPMLLMTWEGTDPSLDSILLNSHMDVVPVFEDNWTHPPFDAFMDENGTIFARGVQDMKSVGIQYIEAIARLKTAGVKLKRTIHVSFVPDEEIGGEDGMLAFLDTDVYRRLRVGFALDEGMASPDDDYLVFYAERSAWPLVVTSSGTSGHGSLLLDDTAGEKLRYVIDKFMDLREENKKKLESNPELTAGDVTTINLTQLGGGVQENVVPDQLTATFDIRLALSEDHREFEDMIARWCLEAGPNVTYQFVYKTPPVAPTALDRTNPYWGAFEAAAEDMNLTLRQRVFPAGTDGGYLRGLGVPVLGFSPLTRTPRAAASG
ncbi:unnamed protein product [Plutella xylostella]|uniref:N-acyl-aliphatic-L-amino acid amidohydrolase n=1 Tax=Plutella xylostella TaxID=51655 RepID=A0A8S4G5E4_PLUXY|nr:unnamed protein product [Plutella xylostella]